MGSYHKQGMGKHGDERTKQHKEYAPRMEENKKHLIGK